MQNFTPGWNDPPSLARNASPQASSGTSSVRNLLNKRIAFPIDGNVASVHQSAPVPPMGLDVSAVLPPNTMVSDPSFNVFQPSNNIPENSIANTAAAESPAQVQVVFTNEEIISILQAALKSCAATPAPIVDNITKRLEKLNQALGQGSFSAPCREKLTSLVNAVKETRFTDAYNLHSVMMVDHFAEVNPWMVGVKALILECQKSHS